MSDFDDALDRHLEANRRSQEGAARLAQDAATRRARAAEEVRGLIAQMANRLRSAEIAAHPLFDVRPKQIFIPARAVQVGAVWSVSGGLVTTDGRLIGGRLRTQLSEIEQYSNQLQLADRAARGKPYAVVALDALDRAVQRADRGGLETPWGTVEYLPYLHGALGGQLGSRGMISISDFLAAATANLIERGH
jgi:hypothetical protein